MRGGWSFLPLKMLRYCSGFILLKIWKQVWLGFNLFKNLTHMETSVYIHFIHKNCTRCIQLMYTKCIPHSDKLLHIFCLQNQKNYASKILHTKCIQKFVEVWDAFCIQMWDTFCIQMWDKFCIYTNILYTFCTLKFVEMSDTFCLYTNILYTFCIHQFWSTKSVHHKHYVYNLYTKFIQNVYTKNCMQNGFLTKK